jgi:hypothetical protein
MNMLKNARVGFFALGAAITAITTSVQAVQVTGTIQITGDVTLNTMSLLTATTATFVGAPDGDVVSGTLAYAAVPVGTDVDFNNFTFAATGPQVVAPLWSFTSGGLTYTFNLANITSITRSTPVPGTDTLGLTGLGTVNITGAGSPYELTNANWSFNLTDTSAGGNTTFVFAFNNSNTATPSTTVPDGGLSVILLGAAMTGLALLRRKLIA